MNARIVDRERRRITLLEMSCPWVENCQQKEEKKDLKIYPIVPGAHKRQHPGFGIKQINFVIDILGGHSKGIRDNRRSLVGEESGVTQVEKNVRSCSNEQPQHCKIM